MRLRAELEQVFLKRAAGGVEAQLVLERESGARERSTMTLAAVELAAASRLLGRALARQIDVSGVGRCRVRVARAQGLVDDVGLRDELRSAFAAERRRLERAA